MEVLGPVSVHAQHSAQPLWTPAENYLQTSPPTPHTSYEIMITRLCLLIYHFHPTCGNMTHGNMHKQFCSCLGNKSRTWDKAYNYTEESYYIIA